MHICDATGFRAKGAPSEVLRPELGVQAPDTLPFEIHVFGDARERGLAQGLLMGAEILDFVEHQLPAFYREEVGGINLDGLPAWLQSLIKSALEPGAEKLAPAAFDAAMGYVFAQQQGFIKASSANVLDEIDGMAEGVCNTQVAAGNTCDQDGLATRLRHEQRREGPLSSAT